jgi:hypothetical protein
MSAVIKTLFALIFIGSSTVIGQAHLRKEETMNATPSLPNSDYQYLKSTSPLTIYLRKNYQSFDQVLSFAYNLQKLLNKNDWDFTAIKEVTTVGKHINLVIVQMTDE